MLLKFLFGDKERVFFGALFECAFLIEKYIRWPFVMRFAQHKNPPNWVDFYYLIFTSQGIGKIVQNRQSEPKGVPEGVRVYTEW